MRSLRVLALALLALGAAGCGPRGPQPIAYGQDQCGYCRMTISDERFGSELVTRRGRVHKFDSVECLANYYLAQHGSEPAHSLWVTDYARPGEFVSADSAHFVQGERVSSPMGMGLLAVSTPAEAERLAREHAGRRLSWEQVLETVARAGARVGAGHAAHGPAAPPPGGAGAHDTAH